MIFYLLGLDKTTKNNQPFSHMVDYIFPVYNRQLYFDINSGERFSKKALVPSFLSSVE